MSLQAGKNPFRSSRIEGFRYRITGDERERLIARLRANGWRGCLIGTEGTGKTTLLEDLEPHLQTLGWQTQWIRLNLQSTPEERRAALATAKAARGRVMLLLDGGETLGWLGWRRLIRAVRQGVGLIATVHKRCPLPIVYETKPDPAIAQALVEHLLQTPLTASQKQSLGTHFQTHQGNLREVLRTLYLQAAKGEEL